VSQNTVVNLATIPFAPARTGDTRQGPAGGAISTFCPACTGDQGQRAL